MVGSLDDTCLGLLVMDNIASTAELWKWKNVIKLMRMRNMDGREQMTGRTAKCRLVSKDQTSQTGNVCTDSGTV